MKFWDWLETVNRETLFFFMGALMGFSVASVLVILGLDGPTIYSLGSLIIVGYCVAYAIRPGD